MFFYKIYDDCDSLSYFKSSLSYENIMKYIEMFKAENDVYLNTEFFKFLKKVDKEFEEIEVNEIFYWFTVNRLLIFWPQANYIIIKISE